MELVEGEDLSQRIARGARRGREHRRIGPPWPRSVDRPRLKASRGAGHDIGTRTTNHTGYFLVYFSIISFMTSAAVLLPFRISCIISVDGGRMWFARR